eukprot:55913_1
MSQLYTSLLLSMIFILINFTCLCQSKCSPFTIDSFGWMKTKLTSSQTKQLTSWVIHCLPPSKLDILTSIDVTGYSKGYGKRLETYATKRSDSVMSEIVFIMEQLTELGYSESQIEKYKDIVHGNTEPITVKTKSESKAKDRKVTIWLDKKIKKPVKPKPTKCKSKKARINLATLFIETRNHFNKIRRKRPFKHRRFECIASKLVGHLIDGTKIDDCYITPAIPTNWEIPMNHKITLPTCQRMIKTMNKIMVKKDCDEKSFIDKMEEILDEIHESINKLDYRMENGLSEFTLEDRKIQPECLLARWYLKMANKKATTSLYRCYRSYINKRFAICTW